MKLHKLNFDNSELDVKFRHLCNLKFEQKCVWTTVTCTDTWFSHFNGKLNESTLPLPHNLTLLYTLPTGFFFWNEHCSTTLWLKKDPVHANARFIFTFVLSTRHSIIKSLNIFRLISGLQSWKYFDGSSWPCRRSHWTFQTSEKTFFWLSHGID